MVERHAEERTRGAGLKSRNSSALNELPGKGMRDEIAAYYSAPCTGVSSKPS